MLEKMIMTSFEIGKEIAFTYLKGADKRSVEKRRDRYELQQVSRKL